MVSKKYTKEEWSVWNEVRDIATHLLACGARLDVVSCNKILLWRESKTLNVTYKEIKAAVILLNAMSGSMSRIELRKLHLDIAKPQSYKIYLAEAEGKQ